ncbi:MAG: beta-galactosidase [Aliiglaciecola sp.]
MRTTKSALFALSLATLSSGCHADTPKTAEKIFSTAPKIVIGEQVLAQLPSTNFSVRTSNADTNWATESGEEILRVTFHSKANSSSGIQILPNKPWDWSELDDFNIAFDIANPGDHSVQLYFDVTDVNGDTYTRTVNVARGGFKTYYAKIAGHDLATPEGEDNVELNFLSGLRSNPETWNSDDIQFISMWGKKTLNTKGIKTLSLGVQHALHDKKIELKNIRLRKNPPMDNLYVTDIVDEFGQNAKEEFDGKVNSLEEMYVQRDSEAQVLTGKLPNHLSKWGGWKDGPKREGTGYFSTAKVDGKWYLVDPDGHLYFATGLDIIRLANSTTMTGYDFPQDLIYGKTTEDVTPEDSQGLNRVSGDFVEQRFLASKKRKNMFTWLPEYNEPLGKHYGYRRSAHSGPLKHGEVYSFYSANLERKYGPKNPNYMEAWREVTIDRMKHWGFTSLGNWTDPSFYDNEEVPFFANGWIIGDFKTVSSGNDFWAPLPDVFDPKFEERAMATASVIAKEIRNSPWCVGIFVDNEKSFGRSESNEATYGIVIHTLKRDGADVPTKQAFTKHLRKKYEDIERLNHAWDLDVNSWEDFNKSVDSTIRTDAQLQDYSDMLYLYADKYFATVDKALNKYVPNHMYLGARFPDWGKPMEVVKASTKYVDVVSYNVYKEGIHPAYWAFLEEVDMPSIIGEFHFGASDSGLYHPGLLHAADQQDRAKMYKEYMESVIDNPYFVGAHWFQYIDSPITGRAHDGENYNVGFVSVTDTPYEPMIKAAKSLHSTMYERRYNGKSTND